VSAVYKVNCPSCGRPFDAAKAQDCDCLETVRSFRCPNCAACFCKAPQTFKKAFWAAAPRDLVERRKQQPPPTGTHAPFTPETVTRPLVLFAEDDATARSIARRVVPTLKRGIMTAKDGEEALAMAREFSPELVITDALMPKVDGREVARIIKLEMPRTRVVVITGLYKDRRYRDEAIDKFGVDDYIAKPVTPAALREIVEKFTTIPAAG
jgi:CheY-like chemotaxis protein